MRFNTLPFVVLLTTSAVVPAADSRNPLPFKVAPALEDAAQVLPPGAVHIDGWLGKRIFANATNRLATIDTAPLLAGFHKKPGTHPWIGEHVGKWMHAATLAWVYTGDERLRTKLDTAAADLIAAQEPDGYLGTYVPEKRFGLFQGADWDVWSHKYNLIGLLTYYQYTGHEPALAACRKMGDLLVSTFGPGRKSILAAGTHVGMAATSVLEPMVLLYRLTDDHRYLGFVRYIVTSWDEPNGPKIIQALLSEKQVNKTANRKAYEMLSNLVGLCELARATGDRDLLRPVLNAWQDIVDKRLYVTGSASQGEHFGDDYALPNRMAAHVAETCVTTTWIQLNLQLLRLTGEARFANELEKTFYNHLAAAQHPRGDDWCYFTALEGQKPYDSGINCCHSSGPRGMALAVFEAYLKSRFEGADVLLVGTFETSSATAELGGSQVSLRQISAFPAQGNSQLRLTVSKPTRFALAFRTPDWAVPLVVKANGKNMTTRTHNGWTMVTPREWSTGDRVDLEFSLVPKLISGFHSNEGLGALAYGPFVFAYDSAANPDFASPSMIGFAEKALPRVASMAAGQLQLAADVHSARNSQPKPARFVPFADAGASRGTYKVWLPAPGKPLPSVMSLLADGQESRSRPGNVAGSINDGDPSSFVVTFDGEAKDADWFAVKLAEPVTISRVIFVSGEVFHDGGWFDSSTSKPRIEIQTESGGRWQAAADIGDYPATTSTDATSLKDASKRSFNVKLEISVKVYGVRVIGKPACGDNPRQAFSSCAELQGFAQ